MSSPYDEIREIHRKVDRILSLLEEVGVVTTRIINEEKGFRLLSVFGPYGTEYVVETPDGRRYSYGRLSTARKWFEKFVEEIE